MRAFALGFALGVVLTATTGLLLLRRGIVVGGVTPALSAAVEAASLEAEAAELELETVPDEVEEIEIPPGSSEEEERSESGSFLGRFFNNKKSSPEASEEKEKEEKPSLLARLRRLLPGRSSEKAAEPLPEPSGPGEFLELGAYPPGEMDFPGGEYHIWDGLLFVEAESGASSGKWNLFCFDLESGEQLFTLPMDDGQGNRSELRRNFQKTGSFFIFTADERREYDMSGQLLSTYTLPDSVRTNEDGAVVNPYQNIYGVRWDVLPEANLLAWCDPEGVWVADAEGNGARLVEDGSISEKLYVENYVKGIYADMAPWERAIFRSVRIMEDGGWLYAECGTPLYTRKHLFGARLPTGDRDLEDWKYLFENTTYFLGFPGSDDTEFPNKSNIWAGYTSIDIVTGETAPVLRWDFSCGYPAVTGDFSTYYGVETTDTAFRLFCYDIKDRDNAQLLLTLPRVEEDEKSYLELAPLAAEGDKVVCSYQTNGGSGLMLVTAKEG